MRRRCCSPATESQEAVFACRYNVRFTQASVHGPGAIIGSRDDATPRPQQESRTEALSLSPSTDRTDRTESENLVTLNDVSFGYGSRLVLRDIDLTVPKGKVVAI